MTGACSRPNSRNSKLLLIKAAALVAKCVKISSDIGCIHASCEHFFIFSAVFQYIKTANASVALVATAVLHQN